jgi:aminopeptidase N
MRKKRFLLAISFFVFICQSKATSFLRSDTIDIRKTIIVFDITDFANKNIFAKASLDIQAKKNNVSQLLFDLEGLTVDSVFVNGINSTFSHTGMTLTINNSVMNMNDTALVDIYYHGIPIADATWGGFSYVGNYAFQMGVGFNAQPHSFGRTWHPCFDNFVERCAYEFFITTTNDKMAVCNGLLLDSILNANSTKTWHWKLEEEIPSYLSAVAVCNYIFVKQVLNGHNGNIDALIACEPADTNNVNGSFAHLQQAFTMLEDHFGTYSWPKVGYSLVPFNYGAMEHATNIHIGKPFINGTLQYETMIAHELSHHWFGDLITCKTAREMWLNEGFASYCEYLHQGFTYGENEYVNYAKQTHFEVLGSAHINDKGYRAVANMDSNFTYGTTVYSKGADMIHTLRTYMGDSLFFNGITSFINTHKFKDVTSLELRDYLSNFSNINLNDFFNNWIFAPGFTHFSIDSTHINKNGSNFETAVFLRQRKHKSTDYYSNVPLEIGFYDPQMQLHIYHLSFTGRCMQFNVSLPFEPVMIVIDPRSKISDAITEQEKIIKSLGNSNLTQAKCNVITKAIIAASDSTLIRIEHNWIAPDRFKNQANANGFILADTRYWKVDGINLQNIQGLIQFPYNANATNFYLDSTWIKNTEDSIRLFYRKDASQEWTFANDSLRAGSLTDKTGSVYAKEIKAGEYCFGIKRSNYVDPIQSDAPTGGCGLATNISYVEKTEQIKVYPNPATNQITIEFPNSINTKSLIELFDLTGKKVMSSKQTSQQKMIVHLPHLPQGIYSLKVTANEHVYFEKVVIE